MVETGVGRQAETDVIVNCCSCYFKTPLRAGGILSVIILIDNFFLTELVVS